MPRFQDLAQPLSQALKALQMYQATHPRSQDALASAKSSLTRFMEGNPRLMLTVSHGKAFLDGKPQDDHGPHSDYIIRTLSDRHISGLVVDADFGDEDLLGSLQVLLLKPQRIEEEGGVERALESRGVQRIRVSQTHYQEVPTNDPRIGGVSGSFPLPGYASGSFPLPGRSPEFPPESTGLLGLQTLLGNLASAPGGTGMPLPGGGPLLLHPAALSSVSDLALGLGMGEAPLPDDQERDLQQSLNALAPGEKLNLIAGLPSLPDRPPALRQAILAMVPGLLASAITGMLQQGYSWEQLEAATRAILKPLEGRQAAAMALISHLRNLHLNKEEKGVSAILGQWEWDETPLEAKVARYLEGGRLLELGPDHRLALLRDLLDRRMDESFIRALEQLLSALENPDANLRQGAAETLAGVCRWAQEPRLPGEAEKVIRKGLPLPFINEPEPLIHRFLQEAFLEMILVWLEHGELAQGTAAVEALRVRMEQEAQRAPWKAQAMAELEAGIRSTRGVEAGIQALHRVEKDQLEEKVTPYLIYQGPPMASALVERLASESDRVARGRIMDGLRALGPLALPPLDRALRSDQWFLVRNVLVLLSEIGTGAELPKVIPLLRHREPRVSRSAVRAVWRLGGQAAESHLLGALKESEPGTQLEILFALAQIKGPSTAGVLLALGEDRDWTERSRAKCLETLVGLATPEHLSALTELARRKGLFGSNAEPLPIRAAALKALASIPTAEATQAVKRILEAEPRGSDRDVLHQAAGS